MRQLAETQNQLRAFQVKIASIYPLLEKTPIATYTAKPIQSVLNPLEQTRFQKLILQRVQIQYNRPELTTSTISSTPTTTPTTKTIKEAPIVQKQEETEKTTNQTPANLAKIQLFIFIIFLNI